MKPILIEDPGKLYFTSDPHYNHANIIKYCKRPFTDVEEMNYRLILNWNSLISHDDKVFILGDFAYGDKMDLTRILNQLSGQKYLIKGNHDRDNCIPNFKFVEVFEGYKTMYVKDPDGHREITLCHFPMMSWQSSHKGSWNLHGHWHNNNVRVAEGPPEEEREISDYVKEEYIYSNLLRPTQYDVGVDGNGFAPISYFEVKKIIQDKINEKRKKETKERR
jgi:calcineurin-like phosphoesterase family protein